MIGRLAGFWEDVAIAAFVALACLSASFISCPQVSTKFLSKSGVEFSAVVTPLGPAMDRIEDDDRESQEDDLEPCGLPGAILVLAPPLIPSQVTSTQSLCTYVLTSALYPLRC